MSHAILEPMTPALAHEKIAAFAESPLPETRVVQSMKSGEFIRQGDVYAEKIETIPSAHTRTENRQLAPGASPGSHHIVAAGPTIFSPDRVNRREGTRLYGPCIEAPKGLTITHPHHAHFILPPGNYQISYQLDPTTQRAVRD